MFICFFAKENIITRWSLVVYDGTDAALHFYLGQKGVKKGDLSKFVEKVVKEIFLETVNAVKDCNSDFGQDEIMDTVVEALRLFRENGPL